MVPQVIDELCTECSSLVENHDKIRVLSAVHYNLGKTLQDVSNISELPTEAEEAEKLLLDDEQLLLVPCRPMHHLLQCCSVRLSGEDADAAAGALPYMHAWSACPYAVAEVNSLR